MDNAASVAFNPDAPADERRDAKAELQKAHAPTSSDIAKNVGNLAPLIDFIRHQAEEQEFQKSLTKQNVIPFPSLAVKNRKPGMQSVTLDDMLVTVQGDWYERPGSMPFDSLRMMVRETPVLGAVIMQRIRQVQRFCRPQENGKGYGFKIALKDKTAHTGPEEEQSIALLQDFFSNCGWEKNPRARRRLKRDDFTSFMGKLVRESLTLDSMPIETEFKRDRSQGIDGMYAVDGATVRLCTELGYEGDDEIYALQVVQGQVRAVYTYDDLIYVPRNPLADVNAGGYGLSETELLVRTVTGFLNAFTYNTKFFDSNQIPKGLLHLSGNYDDNDITAFKRFWNAMVKGINNAWSLPVMVSKDQESKATFENFGVEVNEIMFAKWMVFLVSIICAIYGIAPEEINFESFTAGTSSLSGDDTEEKLVSSKDKGLRPLLSYFENLFTDYVVSEYGDKYVFRWTGLDEEDPKSAAERQKLSMTWNEMRALDDLPKIPGKVGDAPLNPALLGAWQQENMPQETDFGQPGQQQPPGDDEGASAEGQDFGNPGDENDTGADFGQAGGDDSQGGGDEPADSATMAKAFGLPVFKIEP
jgi:hypothetical protein